MFVCTINMKAIALLFIFMGPVAISAQTLVITNDPMNITVCTGSVVNIPCGFVNDSANFVPNWRIIKRSSDGSVISNMSISGSDINNNVNDGLDYLPDTTSGLLMSPKSRLVVGPVDETNNQSSYQCSFALAGGNVESDVGTLTVTGIPPVENLMAVDNCASVTVSWNITDEGSCKDLSYNVLLTSLDDGVILQSMMTNDTSHTFTGVEASNEMFSVNVSTFNENATGSSCTANASVNAPNDLPSPIGLRNTSRICVTYFNISWNASNRTTCGDVFYNVSVFQSSTEKSMKQFTGINDTFDFSVTGLDNRDPDVTVTVTASNRAGQGNRSITVQLPESLDPPPVTNAMISAFETPPDLNGFDITISWDQPNINQCTTLPITGYIIEANVTFMNGSNDTYRSIFIKVNDTNSISVSYNKSFNVELEPNASYNFTVNSTNAVPPPPEVNAPESNSNGLSPGGIGAIIAIAGAAFIGASIAGGGATHLHKNVSDDEKQTEKSDQKKDDDTGNKTGNKTVICMWILFIASLGLGFIFLMIYLCCRRYYCRKRKDVLPDKVEMTGQSDLYASPKKINQGDTDNKATQDLYSYATTGPINVVMPGGKP